MLSPELNDDYELAKFGYWGKEFRKLNLPSSRGVYLFLARIPLDIMYSYFHLRLETNPEKPSPMSLLQVGSIQKYCIIHLDKYNNS